MYPPLNESRQEVRILRLHAAVTDDRPVEGTLQTVSLMSDLPPVYETISYRWAEVPGASLMVVDDEPCEARASAIKVLKHYRPATGTRALWIDAICINQSDIAERASQVRLMGEVYRDRTQCLIWLGDADKSIPRAISSIRLILNDALAKRVNIDNCLRVWNFADQDRKEMLSGQHLIDQGLVMEALQSLLSRAWFRRLWVSRCSNTLLPGIHPCCGHPSTRVCTGLDIVPQTRLIEFFQILQESRLAPSATCSCGPFQVSWMDVCRACTWLPLQCHRFRSLWANGDSRTGTVLVTQNTRFRFQQDTCFRRLLPWVVYMETSEPRDKIFGLLGLCDGRSTGFGWHKRLIVDYTRPLHEVFSTATKATIEEDGTLHVLATCRAIGTPVESVEDNQMPSWVPRLHNTVTLNGDDDSHVLNYFRAGGDGVARGQLILYDPVEVLSLMGFVIDQIDTSMPVIKSIDLSSPRSFRYYFDECRASLFAHHSHRATETFSHAIARAMASGDRAGHLCRIDLLGAEDDAEFNGWVETF